MVLHVLQTETTYYSDCEKEGSQSKLSAGNLPVVKEGTLFHTLYQL